MTQSQRTLVAGKVAKILNDRELVLNKGSEDGVEIGDKFKLIEVTEEIFDPDTENSLGIIRREIIRVKIVHLEPLMAVAQTYETYTRRSFNPYAGIIPGTSNNVTEVRNLQKPGSSTKEDYLVRIGDEVIQFEDD